MSFDRYPTPPHEGSSPCHRVIICHLLGDLVNLFQDIISGLQFRYFFLQKKILLSGKGGEVPPLQKKTLIIILRLPPVNLLKILSRIFQHGFLHGAMIFSNRGTTNRTLFTCQFEMPSTIGDQSR